MPDTPRARALAAELRGARKAAGLTMRELADKVGWSEAKVSRLETAQRGLALESVTAFIEALDVQGIDRDRLLKMAHELDQPVWWEFGGGVPVQLSELAAAESRARDITMLSQVCVPGLLQTWEYSRALLNAADVDPGSIEQLAAIRQARQGVLTREDPVRYSSFIDEAVLCRAVGGSRTMADQLRQIVKIAELPNVTVQVIPFSVGAHTGLDGSFVLLEFIKANSVVHLEQRRSGVFLDDPEDLRPFLEARANLQQIAMGTTESSELIARYAERHERGE